MLEVFNNLLRHLRISIDRKSADQTQRNEEIKFEDVIVNTIGKPVSSISMFNLVFSNLL